MARGLGTLVVDLILKAGGFESDMGRASKTTQKRMKEIEKSVKDAGKVIGVALVAGATAATVALKGAIDNADELSKAAQKIGIPTDVLSSLKYAGDLADVSFEQLQSGLGKLIKFQAAAAQGGKEQTQVFEAFGIAVKDTEGNLRATQDVIGEFADVFKALPDGPEKTALALRVFGKAGAELIPLLNAGSAGLRKQADELERLGGKVTPEAGRQAEAFNDNLTRLQVAVGGLANQVASDLLPDLVSLADQFVETSTAGDGINETARGIADSLRVLGKVALAIGDVFQGVAQGILAVYEAGKLLNPARLQGTIKNGEIKQSFIGAKDFASASASEFSSALGRFTDEPKPSSGYSLDYVPKNISGPSSRGTLSKKDRETQAAARSLYMPEISDKPAKIKKEKTEIEKLLSSYQSLEDSLKSQVALYGEKTEVAKLTYDLENGELSKLDGAQKQNLLNLAEELDAKNEADKKTQEGKALTESLISPLEKINEERAKAKELLDAGAISQETYNRAMEASFAPAKQLLEDIKFESELIKLTNAERETAIQLRGMDTDSINKYGEEILALNQKIQDDFKAADAMDNFRSSFEDAFASILDGSKSIKDAFTDLGDAIVAQIARMIAQDWVNKLFGEQGSTGGGGFGDLISGFFSSFSSGSSGGFDLSGTAGFATGGTPPVGVPYIVGENGPELRIDKSPGLIVPNHKLGLLGGGQNVTVNFSTSTPMSRQTQDQLAQVVFNANRRASRTI